MIFSRRGHRPSAEATAARRAAEKAAQHARHELAEQRSKLPAAEALRAEIAKHNMANGFDELIWNQMIKGAR